MDIKEKVAINKMTAADFSKNSFHTPEFQTSRLGD